jgi:hypothetical protein
MDERVLIMNADIQQLSGALLAQADETWSDIQQQTVKIIHEATERLAAIVVTPPYGDPDHWLHDLRSPGASMLSAVNLLLDEAEITPSSVDVNAVLHIQEKILTLREAIEEMSGARAEF